MAAPRPTPTILRLVKGNPGRRKINKREPKPRRVVPSCPAYLSDSGKIAWGRLTVILDRIGVLTEADALALERLCDCYSDILASRELIERDGRTYRTVNESGQELMKANPAVAQLRAAESAFRSYLIEFGLTPAARSKVTAAPDANKKADPLGQYFG
mgnify:CR=1 FL=1